MRQKIDAALKAKIALEALATSDDQSKKATGR